MKKNPSHFYKMKSEGVILFVLSLIVWMGRCQ